MTTWFWIGVAILYISTLAIVLLLIAHADEGFQDADGFHTGPRVPSDREVQP